MHNSRFILFVMLILALAAIPATALWSSDPTVNLSIADRGGDQTLPKIASTAGGGCYAGWHDPASGNYDIYLQRLDALGNELWAHNGILVSDHPQDTWLVDWDLAADDAGNAILVFCDIRAGGDWDVYAYSVAPDGTMLWGDDGIALSDNVDFEATPRVAVASDGDLVFVWSRNPDSADGTVMMQRLAPDGTLRLAAGGLPIAAETGKSPGFCVISPADAGAVVVGWLRDTSGYIADRYYRAEKFGTDGLSLWGAPVEVYDETVLPIGYEPTIQSDEAGGALLLWHRYYGGMYNSCVQHLDASGTELFPHNGLVVSTNAAMYHISPTMALSGGDIYVFWDERNGSQSQWGIFGQRFDAVGTRLWGSTGRMFLPTDTLYKLHYRALPASGGAMVFWIDVPSGYGSDRIRGFRVDVDGNFLWPGNIVDIATTPSSKGRLPVALGAGGTALLLWEDDRSGSPDIYGQNVKADGSLGGDGTGVDITPLASSPRLDNYPNPFNPKTAIRFELPRNSALRLSIHDITGRHLATLAEGYWEAGSHELAWNGRNGRGESLSSGVYLAKLLTENGTVSRRLVLLK